MLPKRLWPAIRRDALVTNRGWGQRPLAANAIRVHGVASRRCSETTCATLAAQVQRSAERRPHSRKRGAMYAGGADMLPQSWWLSTR